ncbi:uncharacterized protein [Paramormyrops kingsleyae]|uniref:uncharacterized protein isoform X1 n=1 Tax=Paramormyrops kingsleyae TaxID=1676925 RepID=UPI003B96BB3E
MTMVANLCAELEETPSGLWEKHFRCLCLQAGVTSCSPCLPDPPVQGFDVRLQEKCWCPVMDRMDMLQVSATRREAAGDTTEVVGFSKPLHRFMRVDPKSIGVVMLFLGGTQFITGIPMKRDITRNSTNIYSSFWLGILFSICGIIYIISEKRVSKKMLRVIQCDRAHDRACHREPNSHQEQRDIVAAVSQEPGVLHGGYLAPSLLCGRRDPDRDDGVFQSRSEVHQNTGDCHNVQSTISVSLGSKQKT